MFVYEFVYVFVYICVCVEQHVNSMTNEFELLGC